MKNFITEEVKEDFLESLKTIVSYPSVLKEGQNGTPFGQAIQDVLEKTLEICRELGLKPTSTLKVITDMQKSVMELSSWPFSVIWMLFHQVMIRTGRRRLLKPLSKMAGFLVVGCRTTRDLPWPLFML